MSDENKNLDDKAEDAFDKAKDSAKKAADKAEDAFDDAKEKANEFAGEAKESAKEFTEGAKKTAEEFTAGAKEAFTNASGDNKKILAGILAIILGGFGIHKFILGYTKEGIILLVCTLILGILTCGLAGWVAWIIGLIEGIIYLTKSDEEFYNTYQVGRKPWF